MYVPPYAAIPDPAVVRALARAWPFASVVTAGTLGLYATHVPLVLVEPDVLIGHVARSNPQVADLDGPALALFHGPHAFVRSDWYRAPSRQVPTWSYAAVHATGVARVLPEPDQALAVLMAIHEPDGEQPSPAHVERLRKGVVAFELAVTRWEGKAKLSQNREPEDRERVMVELAARGEGQDLEVLALMRRPGVGTRAP